MQCYGIILNYVSLWQKCVIQIYSSCYFELTFIMIDVGNLYSNLEGYFKLSCVMAEVGNLDAELGGLLYIFFLNDKAGQFFI